MRVPSARICDVVVTASAENGAPLTTAPSAISPPMNSSVPLSGAGVPGICPRAVVAAAVITTASTRQSTFCRLIASNPFSLLLPFPLQSPDESDRARQPVVSDDDVSEYLGTCRAVDAVGRHQPERHERCARHFHPDDVTVVHRHGAVGERQV